MFPAHRFVTTILAAAFTAGLLGCSASLPRPADGTSSLEGAQRERPFERRGFPDERDARWIGHGIAYGPYRDGQRPGGPDPSRDQLREDLHLMAKNWEVLRVYGSTGPTEILLELIREENVSMRVMLGAWIAAEEVLDEEGEAAQLLPEVRRLNQEQVDSAIRLANEYPEIVWAVSVGNESQVHWTGHRSRSDVLIRYIRQVRAGTRVPVTTADDFNFWNKPESSAVGQEVDFLVLHAHPLWNGQQLEDAVAWTREQFHDVQSRHPDLEIVLGETGWATQRHTEGLEAELMKGRQGEAEQAAFLEAFNTWVRTEGIRSFFFEAFDENWKGGDHPDEVEKHWGLYRADRTPKQALSKGAGS